MIILFPNHQLSLKASTPTRYIYEKSSPTRAPVKNIKINSFRVNYQVPAESKNRQRRKKNTTLKSPAEEEGTYIHRPVHCARELARRHRARQSAQWGARLSATHRPASPRQIDFF